MTTEVGVFGESGWTLDAGQRAALEAGKSLVCVVPPAGWALRPLLERLPPLTNPVPDTLVLAPETTDGLDLADAIRALPAVGPLHLVTGLARSASVLRREGARTLVATPPDTVHLLRQSSFSAAAVRRVVIAWPELHLAGGHADALDTVLAECPGAQRLVATADDGGIAELIARHARRAPVVAWSRLPQQPSGTARYVVVPHEGRAAAVRGVLDALNPGSALVWDPLAWRRERWQADYAGTPGVSLSGALPSADAPVDLVLAVDLPPPEVVSTAMPRAAGVVALVRAAQLPYLRRVVRELAPLRLPGPTDLARQRLQALHQRIRDRIVDQDRTGDLLALEPLFDEFDPALVAAALVAVPPPAPESELAAWVRLHVSVGRRDRVRPADLLGALINGVGLPKDHVGRIDIREGFSLVEIRAGDAARAVQGLTGLTLRGRRVTARPERG